MRFLSLIFIFIISNQIVFSQDLPGGVKPEEIDPAEGKQGSRTFQMSNRTYFHLGANAVNMNNLWALEVGAGAGFMLSKYFAVGINYNYLFTHTIKVTNEPSAHINMNNFGLEGKFFALNTRKIKIPIHTYFAFAFSQKLAGNQIGGTPGGNVEWSFFLEPGISVDYNFMSDMWLSLGGNYRYHFGFDAYGMESEDLSGIVVSLKYKYYIY